VCGLLFCGTVLLFSRATHGAFINYDDPSYVTDNPHVQGGLSWDGIAWAFTAPADYWHPLTWLSHMLDWQLYGPAAAGHHLTSVLWHALNAVLAFFVFRRLAGGFWLSAFAAALFAWHPLRVESVAWITERKDVMSGCFFLLTLLAYARYVAGRTAVRPWKRPYLLTLACFAAGLMSKPTLVTLPLVLLILDFWPFARYSSPASLRLPLVEKIPFFALSGVTAVLTVLMQRQEGSFVLDVPFGARAGNAVVSLARYLGRFFWPFDLIVCYPHPGYWPAPVVLSASALALGLCWLAWRQRRFRPWILAGWLWLLVVLLPVIGLVQVGFQAMADRYTYLPLLGVELALLWSLPGLGFLRAWSRASLAAIVLAACAARTWNQEGVWRNSVSLFEHAVAVSDRNDVAEYFLASALYAAGRMDEAAVHAQRARALNPRNDKPLIMLAGIRERQGRISEARELLRAALALRPGNPPVQAQLGLLELGSGHVDEARRLMTDALRSAPDLRERTRQIGRTALEQGDTTVALFLYELVLAAAPDDAEAHAGAGLVLLARNDAAGAIVHLRAAVKRAPALADAQLALAACAEQLGRTAEASAALARAEASAPDSPVIQSGVAELYARRRDFPTAIRLYRRVVELDPADSRAHAALGYLLIHAGDHAGGVAEWRRALELNPNIPGLRDRLQQEEK
jgi:tetratricopeptide (TPR) repeat protein